MSEVYNGGFAESLVFIVKRNHRASVKCRTEENEYMEQTENEFFLH